MGPMLPDGEQIPWRPADDDQNVPSHQHVDHSASVQSIESANSQRESQTTRHRSGHGTSRMRAAHTLLTNAQEGGWDDES